MNSWRQVRLTDLGQAIPVWAPQYFLIAGGDGQLVSPGLQSVGGNAKQLPLTMVWQITTGGPIGPLDKDSLLQLGHPA